jgi:methylamine dehydrogenase heavy chain
METMRSLTLILLCLGLMVESSAAQMAPEEVGVAVFPEPTDSWFLIKTRAGSYVFDGATGEMQGLISHDWYTTAVVTDMSRKEAYLLESFYSRSVRGKREDVLTVVDMNDLSAKAEIDIPDKTATLSFRNHIGLLGDGRHVVIFNMTPAQSVSIVDVIDREFAGEISTPGCAIIMPTGTDAFMMMCGDGTLQYIRIDPDGAEAARERSKPFFVVDEDPVIDKPMRTTEGWVMISYEGLAYQVVVEKGKMKISEPWSLLSEEDKAEKWRPGGDQPFSVHRESGLLYVLMHQGGADTHYEPGTEIWAFDLERKKRVGRLSMGSDENEGNTASHILVSQEPEPTLYVFDKERKLHIYDGILFRLLRTIDQTGPGPGLLQLLAQDD